MTHFSKIFSEITTFRGSRELHIQEFLLQCTFCQFASVFHRKNQVYVNGNLLYKSLHLIVIVSDLVLSFSVYIKHTG